MKKLLILVPLFVIGCSPVPMDAATSAAFEKCIDKGWQPRYFSNGIKIDFTCLPEGTGILKLKSK